MVPYVFTTVIQNPTLYKTIKISPANFNINEKKQKLFFGFPDFGNFLQKSTQLGIVAGEC